MVGLVTDCFLSTPRVFAVWLLVTGPSVRCCVALVIVVLRFTSATSFRHCVLSLAISSNCCHWSVGASIIKSPSHEFSKMCLAAWKRSRCSECCLVSSWSRSMWPTQRRRLARIQLMMLKVVVRLLASSCLDLFVMWESIIAFAPFMIAHVCASRCHASDP